MINLFNTVWYKKTWFIGLLLFVVLVIAGLIMFLRVEQSKSGTSYDTEFIFKEQGRQVEVRVKHPENITLLFENGVQKETLSLVPSVAKSLLTLPVVDKTSDIVNSKAPTSTLTWDSTLEESSMYVKFLESKGYKPIREVHTSEFIEKVVELGGVRRRIVIFNHIIMVGDLQKDAKMSDLSEYLKKYR